MKKLTAIILALGLALGLFACGGSKSAGPEDTVVKLCEAMKNFDMDGMDACIKGSEGSAALLGGIEGVESELLGRMKDLAKDIEYSIGEAKVDGSSAVVPVRFEFTDSTNSIAAVMDEYIDRLWDYLMSGSSDEDLTEEGAMEFFSQAIADKWDTVENERMTLDTEFTLVKENKKWLVSEMSEDLGTVITANMAAAIDNFVGETEGFEEEWDGDDPNYDAEGWDDDWSDDWTEYETYDGFGELVVQKTAFGRAIPLRDYAITFTACREADRLENDEATYEAEPGTKFVIYDFTVKNTGSATINFTNEILQLYDENNTYCEFYDDYLFCEDYLWYTDIEPGETAKSTIVYYIPDTIGADEYFVAVDDGTTVYTVYGR